MFKRILDGVMPQYTPTQQHNAVYLPTSWFFIQLLQLTSLVALVWMLHIEQDKGFDRAVIIIGSSFLLYMPLPLRFRKIFLLLLSFTLLFLILGFKIAPMVIGVVLVFCALTFIKIRWILLVTTILLGLGSVLLAHYFIVNQLLAFAIYYAALFLMIRYIYLLYETRFIGDKFNFIDRLNYLLMVPNICFPLFPPYDPKVYLKAYYQTPANENLQKALVWITRGIFHTLLYRTVYMFYTPSTYEITDFVTLLQFIISSYFLIVRMSGLFYISIGFFTLFGFNSPPIFNNYFFTSGFSDLWRRVNIYWSDFLVRIIYYPMLFRLRKLSATTAVLWSTLLLFFSSWVFHSWQWYWIKGMYMFTWNDFLFWNFLGLMIFLGSYSRIKNRTVASVEISFKKSLWHAAKVVSVFLLMSLLWSMWTSSTLREWIYLMSFFKFAQVSELLWVAASFSVMVIIGATAHYMYSKKKWFNFVFTDHHPRMGLCFTLVLLAGVGYTHLSHSNNVVSQVVDMNLNQRDKAILERGYYERLLNNERQRIELMDAIANRPAKWNVDPNVYRSLKNELRNEFKPNMSTTFKGDTLTTNSFGIRDKEYKKVKPDKTFRMVFLGGSYEMGSGVSNNENYPALVENMLNEKQDTLNIEILNFAMGGYHLIQSTYTTKHKIGKYKPDAVIYAAHSMEVQRCLENLVGLIEKDILLTDTFLIDIVKKADIQPEMCRLEKYNRLKPFAKDVVKWGYTTISEWCRKHHAVPIWIYLPASVDLRTDDSKDFCFATAKTLGFVIFNLENAYQGHKALDIQLNEWDTHPNEKGHQLVANALFHAMSKNNAIFKQK